MVWRKCNVFYSAQNFNLAHFLHAIMVLWWDAKQKIAQLCSTGTLPFSGAKPQQTGGEAGARLHFTTDAAAIDFAECKLVIVNRPNSVRLFCLLLRRYEKDGGSGNGFSLLLTSTKFKLMIG